MKQLDYDMSEVEIISMLQYARNRMISLVPKRNCSYLHMCKLFICIWKGADIMLLPVSVIFITERYCYGAS